MSATRVGLISDTHGLLRTEAKKILGSCDLILHAGDLDHPLILEELEKIAPTVAVRGNMDLGIWARRLKPVERLEIATWSILLIHNRQDLPALDEKTNLVIYGHSHRFLEEQKDGVWYLNPGSAGPRRFQLPITMAVLTLGDHELSLEKIRLKSKA